MTQPPSGVVTVPPAHGQRPASTRTSTDLPVLDSPLICTASPGVAVRLAAAISCRPLPSLTATPSGDTDGPASVEGRAGSLGISPSMPSQASTMSITRLPEAYHSATLL